MLTFLSYNLPQPEEPFNNIIRPKQPTEPNQQPSPHACFFFFIVQDPSPIFLKWFYIP